MNEADNLREIRLTLKYILDYMDIPSDKYLPNSGSKVCLADEGNLYMIRAATPEPRPHKGQQDILPKVIEDLRARGIVGRNKYGTTLQTNNGRDALIDAYQEALDLAMYLKQAIIERD